MSFEESLNILYFTMYLLVKIIFKLFNRMDHVRVLMHKCPLLSQSHCVYLDWGDYDNKMKGIGILSLIILPLCQAQ